MAKLILVADYAISNSGAMPDQKMVRQYGHKLADLMDAADKIAVRHSLKLDYPRPTAPISAKIIECLDEFADAGRGRYANFAALGDPNLGKEEPIRKWWGEVAELILSGHYYGRPIQEQVEHRARGLDALMSPVSMVLYINETGDAMQDVLTSSIRTGQTEIVQRFGRYYALTIVRWLSQVLSELSRSASFTHNVGAFSGVWEYLQTYTVNDTFLKTRKKWPLT